MSLATVETEPEIVTDRTGQWVVCSHPDSKEHGVSLQIRLGQFSETECSFACQIGVQLQHLEHGGRWRIERCLNGSLLLFQPCMRFAGKQVVSLDQVARTITATCREQCLRHGCHTEPVEPSVSNKSSGCQGGSCRTSRKHSEGEWGAGS